MDDELRARISAVLEQGIAAIDEAMIYVAGQPWGNLTSSGNRSTRAKSNAVSRGTTGIQHDSFD